MKHQSIKLLVASLSVSILPLPSAWGQRASEHASANKDYSHSTVVTRIMAFDLKHEGKLTRDQITDWRFLRLFDEADADHDGIVTTQELESLAAKLDLPRRQGPGGFGGFGAEGGFDGPPGGPGGPGGPGAERRHVDWQEKVSQLDLTKLPAPASTKDLKYEKDIRPLLTASCTQCHGSDRTRGGLRLDSLEALRQGGDNGPAIEVGKSKESHIVIAAARIDADTAMPPQRGRRFDPMGMVAGQMIRQAHGDNQAKVSKDQFVALAKTWFDAADREKTGSVNQDQFASAVSGMLRPQGGLGPGPQGGPGPGSRDRQGDDRGPGGPAGPGGPGGPGRFGPGGPPGFDPFNRLARAMFKDAAGQDNASLTPTQLQNAFGKWFDRWDTEKSGSLTEQEVRTGLAAIAPEGPFGGPGGLPPGGRGFGGPRGPGGPGGPGGGPEAKPLTSDQVALIRAWIDQGAK